MKHHLLNLYALVLTAYIVAGYVWANRITKDLLGS